jgi:hypothetical protein
MYSDWSKQQIWESWKSGWDEQNSNGWGGSETSSGWGGSERPFPVCLWHWCSDDCWEKQDQSGWGSEGSWWTRGSGDWHGGGSGGWEERDQSGWENRDCGGDGDGPQVVSWSQPGYDAHDLQALARVAVQVQSSPTASVKFEEPVVGGKQRSEAKVEQVWVEQHGLEHPLPPSEAHASHLADCVARGRHSILFNQWANTEDLDFPRVSNTDEDLFYSWMGKLATMNAPIANVITLETRHLPKKKQDYALTKRLDELLQTGAILVASSQGLSSESSFISNVCPQCHAKLHFNLPYFGVGGNYDPAVAAAVSRHMVHFFWTSMDGAVSDGVYPGVKGSMPQCTAEQCMKGSKHFRG